MISVLIAVYNTAEYLPKCLDSLKNNAYKDLEVIAVDDASTDNSLEILQQYSAEDNRFKVIHLERNSGQSHARNIALQHATGDWIMMLDSDDWISDIEDPDLVQQKATPKGSLDCILLQCTLTYPDGSEKRVPLSRSEWTPQEATLAAISWSGIHGLYLIRTEIHKRYPFDESTMLYGDDNTSRLHFLNSKRIGVCNTIYYYRQHSQSTTHKVSDKIFNELPALRSLQESFEKEPLATEEMKQELRNFRWKQLSCCMVYYIKYKGQLQDTQKDCAEMQSSYDELINTRISSSLRYKVGFWHIRPYCFYKAQVRLYYFIREILGKNRSL